MNFLADENIDTQIVTHLRKHAHNILYVLEMEPGISDEMVLSTANQHNALLLTADKDFGELVFRRQQINAGVVLIRLLSLTPQRKAELLLNVINQHQDELANAFTVITTGTVRIRKRTFE